MSEVVYLVATWSRKRRRWLRAAAELLTETPTRFRAKCWSSYPRGEEPVTRIFRQRRNRLEMRTGRRDNGGPGFDRLFRRALDSLTFVPPYPRTMCLGGGAPTY
jgi:hypothetical protein